jgi:hypothetical protein
MSRTQRPRRIAGIRWLLDRVKRPTRGGVHRPGRSRARRSAGAVVPEEPPNVMTATLGNFAPQQRQGLCGLVKESSVGSTTNRRGCPDHSSAIRTSIAAASFIDSIRSGLSRLYAWAMWECEGE